MELHADVWHAYADWQSRHKEGWGLTWLLASELCDRFYASHGIAPRVIEHEGTGYYGIQLVQIGCSIEKESKLGRFTAAGNVENWITGGPGDHGLKLIERADAGEPIGPMLAEAIRYLGVSPVPQKSHIGCKHKRWGTSYQLVFRMSALLALRWNERVRIWNDPYHTSRLASEVDPQHGKGESAGHFLWIASENRMFVAGDARVLVPTGTASMWQSYMEGRTVSQLLQDVENTLGLRD